MGAELQNLPEPMKQKTKVFFEENIQWLQHVLLKSEKVTSEEQSYQIAIKIVATLEGAMIVSQTLNNDACFDAAIAGLSTLEFF